MIVTSHIKNDFPIFRYHPELIYLDSAATSLKPRIVIDAEREYYEQYGVNVHRGVYALSVKATDAYEGGREKVRKFINAKSTKEIIFVRGATEGINLVASTLSFHPGDAVLISEMEHHSNIVPWFPHHPVPTTVASGHPSSIPPFPRRGRGTPPEFRGGREEGTPELRWLPISDDGQLDLSNIDELLKGVKLVAMTQMSNVLGTVNDVKFLAQKAHAVGAKILVDAAQSVPHMPVDVQDLDCDFLVFSGHKMLGPTGIGVLYAKEEILKDFSPYQRGGDMILEVTKEGATWNELPWKFEAGTPNIAGALGLGAAVDYLSNLGMENVWRHEQELVEYGLRKLSAIPGVMVLGASPPAGPPPARPKDAPTPPHERRGRFGRGAIFAFTVDGIHPHDIGSILDEHNIAVRAGHHCAMVLHRRFGLTASARASCYVYNTKADIDALVRGIEKVKGVFA